MATTSELLAREAALEEALASGVRVVKQGDREVTYRGQTDLRAALADVRREIRGTPVNEIRFSTSKGLSR